MQSHMSKQKKITIGVLIAAVLILLAVVVFMFFSRLERSHDVAPEGAGLALSRTSIEETDAMLAEEGISPMDDDSEVIPTLFYNGQEYVYKDRLTSLLILGIDDNELVDSASSRNTSQADFILLAVFDPDTQECTLLQINRDTMSDVPALDASGNYIGMVNEQLALSHTYGNGMEKSCENTVYAISRFLYGVTINNYFALTMDAIPVLNDLVGGVTVKIEDDFTGIDESLVKGETVMLTAENVEHFVRSRMSMVDDPTNIARMRRQRTYMTALFESLSRTAKADAGFVIEAYAAVAGSLVTDCSIDELSDYANRFSGYTLSEIITPEGESVIGDPFMEFYVDEASLQQMVIDTFYEPVG